MALDAGGSYCDGAKNRYYDNWKRWNACQTLLRGWLRQHIESETKRWENNDYEISTVGAQLINEDGEFWRVLR